MEKKNLLDAVRKAQEMGENGDLDGAREMIGEVINKGFEDKLREIIPIINMMGFDVHRAPDGMSFTVMPNDMASLMHPILLGDDMKNAMHLRIEFDMLAPARQTEVGNKVCSIFLLDILHVLGENMAKAAEASKMVKRFKKEDDSGSTIA